MLQHMSYTSHVLHCMSVNLVYFIHCGNLQVTWLCWEYGFETFDSLVFVIQNSALGLKNSELGPIGG